ncbi:MAG: hypothetical protein A3C56_13195 [Ignavibacteria bacterium RIFCSPHIGHO2_02_FULL_56_12]|nr:MAG: hypothetical protein A3C56_13195 [Ignavibacteria bacterium RIFCSPHIGHO2_02_FULL_56_12]
MVGHIGRREFMDQDDRAVHRLDTHPPLFFEDEIGPQHFARPPVNAEKADRLAFGVAILAHDVPVAGDQESPNDSPGCVRPCGRKSVSAQERWQPHTS